MCIRDRPHFQRDFRSIEFPSEVRWQYEPDAPGGEEQAYRGWFLHESFDIHIFGDLIVTLCFLLDIFVQQCAPVYYEPVSYTHLDVYKRQ